MIDMDYKKKYDEALERARKLKEMYPQDAPGYEEVFPELRESEDERIRKEMLEYLKRKTQNTLIPFSLADANRWIAYLEKQKEPVVDKEGMYYYLGGEFIYCGFPVTTETPYDFAISQQEKQKEQKPVECITDAEMEKGLDELTKFKQFASALSDMYNIIPSHSSLRPKDIDWNNFCAGLLTYLKRNQPAEWSEEDNIGWDEAFACVTRAEKEAKNEEELQNAATAEKWLKEIKFKYYVHPVKQEWGKNDLDIILAIRAFYKCEREDLVKYFESLRPSWKPSEEQEEPEYYQHFDPDC